MDDALVHPKNVWSEMSEQVLILVLMDDALVPYLGTVVRPFVAVLILVLMDDALVHGRCVMSP